MSKINQCNESNERIGFWVVYDGDGKKWFEGSYVNGKRNGKWIHYKFDGTEAVTFHNHEDEVDVYQCDDND